MTNLKNLPNAKNIFKRLVQEVLESDGATIYEISSAQGYDPNQDCDFVKVKVCASLYGDEWDDKYFQEIVDLQPKPAGIYKDGDCWVYEWDLYYDYEEDLGYKLMHNLPITESYRKSRRFRNSKRLRESVSNEDVRELVLYITNNGDMYRGIIDSTVKNLRRKIKRGIYDEQRAIDAWMYVADEGVRRYDREFGSGRGSLTFLDKPTRREIAKELKDEYDEYVREGVTESYRGAKRTRSLNESEEIARQLFVTLTKDNYGYYVLNDGYYVCNIAARNDDDAIDQFYDFLDTDWKRRWKDGTLPKYFGESYRRKRFHR